MKHKLIVVLMLFLCASPVAAITYSEEYYALGNQSNTYEQFVLDLIDSMKPRNNMWDGKSHLMLHYDIERQNILLKKQNELQAELVKAQWVETCYAPFDNNAIGNRSAWSLECANAGYPVG